VDKTPIPEGWEPETVTIQRLAQLMIPAEFCADLVPEFRLYWMERGTVRYEWDTTFIRFIQKAWLAKSGQRLPVPIPTGWQPSKHDIAALSAMSVPEPFWQAKLLHFRLYWTETGKPRDDWGQEFVRWTSKQWNQSCRNSKP